jgi:hypothetical protein
MYSGTNVTFTDYWDPFGHHGAYYTFSSATNTITASDFSSVSNSNNIFNGKLFTLDNFSIFYEGQIIYSIDQSKFLLIKSISSDFNTLYLDSTFSIVDNVTIQTGAKFTTQYSIYDTTLNFKAINPNIFGSNYLLSTFKLPMSTGIFSNSDKLLSELYFPVNTISTSNSTVTSMTIPKIFNVPTQILSNSSFRNISVTGSSDISFNSTTNTIISTSTNINYYYSVPHFFVFSLEIQN